jgi:hypothetical protein
LLQVARFNQGGKELPETMRQTAVVLITGLYLVGAGSARLGAADPVSTSASKDAILKTLAADPDVVWIDAAKTQPMFIPERLLNTTVPLDQLPIPSSVLRDIHGLLNPPAKAGSSGAPFCRWMSMLGIGPLKLGDVHSIDGHFEKNGLQVIGWVTNVEIGLFFWPQNVASMVQVQVEEVVRDDWKLAEAGQEMRFYILGGSLNIEESAMCTRSINPPFQAKVDQRLYIFGLPFPSDPRLIDGAVPFIVSGDQLLDAGYDRVSPFKPITLEEARQRAHKAAVNVH